MRVGIVAPPWYLIPPKDYAGIERIIQLLVEGLTARGIDVTLVAHPDSTVKGAEELISLPLSEPPHPYIADPLYEIVGLPIAHQLLALEALCGRLLDLVHDHNLPLAKLAWAYADRRRFAYPRLLTAHGPLKNDERPLSELVWHYGHGFSRWVFFNGISQCQLHQAPKDLILRTIQPWNAILNAVHLERVKFRSAPEGLCFAIVGRIDEQKRQGVAAEICYRRAWPLHLYGAVAEDITSLEEFEGVLADPSDKRNCHPGFLYFHQEVYPYLKKEDSTVFWHGLTNNIPEAMYVTAHLMPGIWPEPFGLVMAEAMMCGTPVVAFRQGGAAAEIVEDGVTGRLCETVEEFEKAMEEVAGLDREVVWQIGMNRFNPDRMVEEYVQLYRAIIYRCMPWWKRWFGQFLDRVLQG